VWWGALPRARGTSFDDGNSASPAAAADSSSSRKEHAPPPHPFMLMFLLGSMVEKLGVACIPCSAFYAPGEDGTKDAGAHSLVRFAFCKTLETIAEAGSRMKARLHPLAGSRGSC
jgi:hypothetical protein